MKDDSHTVAVVATPPGTGAIAIVRVSGLRAFSMIKTVFVPSTPEAAEGKREPFDGLFDKDRIRHGQFRSGDEVIDEVLVSAVSGGAQASFDICTHGSVRIVERVLQELESLGASLVTGDEASHIMWPAANRIEREAIDALTHAPTERAVRFLAWQKTHLVEALKQLEFQSENDGDEAYCRLERIHQRYESAAFLLNGATIALLGPPNSGKSTLFNRLVGREATIVSRRAGTTRDWVTAKIEMDGIPLTLIDTAGDHANPEALEKLAIEAGKGRVHGADLCILVLDGSLPITDAAKTLCAARASYPHCLTVANKCDLSEFRQRCEMAGDRGEPPLAISAMTGKGMKNLEKAICVNLGLGDWVDFQPSAFTFRQYCVVREILADRPYSSQDLQVAIKRLLIGS